jgi:streptogramin lyase
VSTTNISIQTDLLKQWLYLTPGTATANTIIAGYTRFANTIGQNVFWSNVGASQSTVSIGSNYYYNRNVLVPDGRVISIPTVTANLGIYNPKNKSFTTVAITNTNYFYQNGGILLPDGRVALAAWNCTNIGLFNPVTNSFTTFSTGVGGGATAYLYSGAALSSLGTMILPPARCTNIGIFNPVTNSFSTFSNTGIASNPVSDYYGVPMVHPNGNIYFPPQYNTNIGIYNPVTNSFTTFSSIPNYNPNYNSAILIPDGRLIFTPSNGSSIGIFNPMTNSFTTFSGFPSAPASGCALADGRVFINFNTKGYIYDPILNTATTITYGTITNNFGTPFLLPNGNIYMPANGSSLYSIVSGNIPVPLERCLHPAFNY